MDWAEALAGFNDAEQDALGELFWLEDKKTTAVIGSVTESLEIESGGYLKNESLQANIKSLAGLGLKKKPAVNSLVELRGKVWRIHEVEALERDTGFNLMLEYVPDLATKYPTIKPEEPAPVEALELNSPQAQRPVNVSASLLANLVTNLTAEASPANPTELIAFEIYAPVAPSLPEASLPQIDIYLVAGQSNADGHSLTADLTATQSEETEGFNFYVSWHSNTSQASSQQFYSNIAPSLEAGKTRGQGTSSTLSDSGKFGIEWGFAKKAKEINLASEDIGIIKYAIGASTIQPSSYSHWDINTAGEAWEGWLNAIEDGVEKYNQAGYNVNIKGLVWYQGESNGGNNADYYLGYFEPLLQELELELGLSNLPAVFCAPADQAGQDMPVDEAFNRLARQYNYYDIVKISQFHDGSYNNVHLNASNMYEAGQAVADSMALAIAGNAPVSSEFSPSTLTSRLWLDMADRATHNITGTSWNEPVTIINDKSGNNYSFTPRAGASIKSITNQQNGKNIFRFNGDTDATNPTSIAFSPTARHKWFIVSRSDKFDAYDTLLLAQKGSPTLQLILFNLSGAGNFLAEWYVNAGTHLRGNSTNLLGQWVMLSVEWDVPNAQASAWLNGTAYNSNVPQNGLNAFGTMQVTLNKYTNIGDADWGELIFTENITQSQSDSIEGYLANKWGLKSSLPSSHPYKHYTP
jgi:hypothetical protein